MSPPRSRSTAARWGLSLSLIAGGATVVFGLQPHLLAQAAGILNGQQQNPIIPVHGAGENNATSTTYCYESLRTAALGPSTSDAGYDSNGEPSSPPNCFTVGPDGRFTRVFSSLSTSLEDSDGLGGGEEIQILPGHVLPGLWDGHGHLLAYGEFLHSADLFGSTSADEVRRRLREYLDVYPDAGTKENWGRGVGWDQMAMGGMPFADLLEQDDALKGKYFMLDRVDVHCTWVSQAVLDLLPADFPDEVPGGEIVRKPGMGVFCDNAMDLVLTLWPKPSKERQKTFVADAMRELHKVGLVGMHNAGSVPEDVALFEEMSRTEDWTLRVYSMLECAERNTFCPEDAKMVDHPDGMLSVRSVKLFADGALGSWGSAMIEPYSDRPDTSGSLLVNASTLTSLARTWSAAGFQVNIHAIGDLANRLAIDALIAALRDLCPEAASSSSFDNNDLSTLSTLAPCQSTHRFRLEHAQIIHPTDQARIHALGILPSIQPTHATSDMGYAALRLGPHRTRTEAYRMRSFLNIPPAGPILGSDFPVEPPNPFEGVYAAVARKSPHTGAGGPPDVVNTEGGDGDDDKGWHKEEALTLAQALDGFTEAVAWGGFMEGKAGVIREGAFADWVVLDEDIMGVGEEGLREVRVRETWVGGRRVFVREEEESGRVEREDDREDL
ncbi:amidohydrolase family-domain-containing protein [Chaetomium sp. MPI-SDFR-AT-0129]|nr:amidohydrolase family-domain-containing protein [Chaetomium sp. MPI-SDFR-AT-0129]